MRTATGVGWLVASAQALFVNSVVVAQVCTLNFDSSCPNSGATCGGTFSGGSGCIVAGLGNCYDSGSRALKVESQSPLTITFPSGIAAVEVFFAHSGPAQGTMRFFDAVTNGGEIGQPLTTNGNCAATKPPRQQRTFSTIVHRIEVEASGSGDVWIDSLALTDATVPVNTTTWSLVKTLFQE